MLFSITHCDMLYRMKLAALAMDGNTGSTLSNQMLKSSVSAAARTLQIVTLVFQNMVVNALSLAITAKSIFQVPILFHCIIILLSSNIVVIQMYPFSSCTQSILQINFIHSRLYSSLLICLLCIRGRSLGIFVLYKHKYRHLCECAPPSTQFMRS